MGFGIDPLIHVGRLWTFPVLYYIDKADNKVVFSDQMTGKLRMAMGDWGNGANQGPLFTETTQSGPGIVTIKLTTGSNIWSSGDTLVGKNPSPSKTTDNTLQLKNDSDYDTLVHELGHLLGLAHEHDRNDDAGNKYRATLAIAFKEEVAKNAIEKKKYKKYGQFDEQSIMCYGTKNTAGPSAGDRATLKAIYGWS